MNIKFYEIVGKFPGGQKRRAIGFSVNLTLRLLRISQDILWREEGLSGSWEAFRNRAITKQQL